MMAACFWACVAAIGFSYVGYPALIFALSRWFGRPPCPPADPAATGWPAVTLVLAAYNEGPVLADRLANALAMDYPRDRFEVVVGSDGSTDDTAAIARRFADRGVILADFPGRRGKAAVLNDLVPAARGEVVLLSDANTMLDPLAARRLARWFADPSVTAACGRLVLVDAATGRNADGSYWKYETFLKRCEARLQALLGANGAIYAIRRDRYVAIPRGTIVDDLVIPLRARLRHGGRIPFEADAVAIEETAADVAGEFRRRRRIGAGGFQALGLLWPLLDPRRGWVALAFVSHKVLRWLGPFCLLGAFGSNVALASRGAAGWRWALAAQLSFYAIPYIPSATIRRARAVRIAELFAGMNLALLCGFFDWALGRRGGTWDPTARPTSRPAEVAS